MAFCIENVMKRISSSAIRKLSTVSEPVRVPEESLQSFRTIENNPLNHTKDCLKRFYTVPNEEKQTIFHKGSLPKLFEIDAKTFNECAIMIRQPALEIMSYLQQTDYTRPVNKYVIYGEDGTGKSITMLHLLHYGYMSKNILVHIPWVQHWYKFPKEFSNSESQPGFMDLPVEAATWLAHFKVQNNKLIKQLDLKTSKDYTWSQRENTPNGTPLLEMIDFGLSRIKFASDIIRVLLQEIKQASIAGKCKTMVIIDGCNALFTDRTRIKNDNYQFVPASQVTITQPFTDIIKSDWNNGAVILSVDICATKRQGDSILPRYLLQKDGFEHLDPFLPVKIDNYDDVEFDMAIQYYKDRKWIRDITPSAQRELQLLTNGNPRKLSQYCAGL